MNLIRSNPTRSFYRSKSVGELIHNPILFHHATPHIGRVKRVRVNRALVRVSPHIKAERPGRGITNHLRIKI